MEDLARKKIIWKFGYHWTKMLELVKSNQCATILTDYHYDHIQAMIDLLVWVYGFNRGILEDCVIRVVYPRVWNETHGRKSDEEAN